MTRPHTPFTSYLLSSILCVVMVGCTFMSCSQLKTEGVDAKNAVVNCTAQELGTVPGLSLATLVAVANLVATEKNKCSPTGGALNWDCVYTDLIGDGEVLGGCVFAKLRSGVPTSTAISALSETTPTAPPGSSQFERFRATVANGAKYHLSDGDH